MIVLHTINSIILPLSIIIAIISPFDHSYTWKDKNSYKSIDREEPYRDQSPPVTRHTHL